QGRYSAPTFADINGDGTLDMVVGSNDGSIHYFKNTGTATAPTFVEQTGSANPFDGVNVGNYANPVFVDLNGDGKLDLVVGSGDGTLHYLENTGTATNPVFVEQTGAANPFDGIDLGSLSGPTFADLDGDGIPDAFVGTSDGKLHYLHDVVPEISI